MKTEYKRQIRLFLFAALSDKIIDENTANKLSDHIDIYPITDVPGQYTMTVNGEYPVHSSFDAIMEETEEYFLENEKGKIEIERIL